MRRLIFIVLAVIVAATAATTRADSLAGQMDVSATVLANCRLTVPGLTFGVYDPLATHAVQPDDASTILTVTCTRNTSASVAFDFGRNSVASGERKLAGPGTDRLAYQVFRDAAHSQVWAAGTEAVQILSQGIASPEQLTVFGRILPRQEVEPGAYTDVLTATVDF